jgi:hypothetical protein
MRTTNDTVAFEFLGLVLGTVAVLWAGIAYANKHYRDVQNVERQARAEVLKGETLDAGGLWVGRVKDGILPFDPGDAAWSGAPSVTVPLVAQAITMPVLDQATVDTVEIQALTDGQEIVWRVRWPDPDASMQLDSGVFSDAVALQFPLVADASFMMGDRGKRVQILQWKGVWQFDVDVHYLDVQDLHPNFWTDLYWFAEGSFPFPVAESFNDPRSRDWFPAVQAGNSQAIFDRRQPVDELVAEGYGSLTPHVDSITRGKGVWADGIWSVTFVRPLRTDDPLDAQFASGGVGNLGIAVWEGASGNVGGRKHWSNWLAFRVQS